MSFETDLIKKITGGTASIKRGEKSPKDACLGVLFNKLKQVNEGQYDDLMIKYKDAVNTYKKIID